MRCCQLVLILLCTSIALAGSISGRVCDIDGNPLVGATVMVVGTSHGAMTDPNGEYFIENLETGVYSLKASMVGMGERTAEGISVRENQVTVYDFGGPEVYMSYPQTAVINEEAQNGRILVHRDDLTVTDLPLEHTSVSISICGNVQKAVVRQIYGNPFDVPIEATYVFPLPNDGAVDQMNVFIGDQLIEGHVYESNVATEIYEEAVEEGRTAGLLVQERPNVFTQTLGNILPGDSITVEISYVAPLDKYEDEYELVFPMVVGPKYIPGIDIGEGERGWSNPTDQVPDADRINPSVYPEGMRSGYDIDLEVTINAGIPIRDVNSVNHEIIEDEDVNIRRISLAGDGVIPNRDFVLRYSMDTPDREMGIIATSGDIGGHFMLVLKPEVDLSNGNYAPKEFVFVVDCSGSMSGQPMAVAKESMRHFIRNMTPEDTFQIIKFSNQASAFSEAPIPATRRNVNLGLAYVELMNGTGGTEMLSGVRAALGFHEDSERDRFVIFLTDGQIGNEGRILEEVRGIRGAHTILWSVGVGSSPNRYLLDGLAEEGNGRSFYVALQEDPGTVAARIYSQVNGSYIRDISFDWGDMSVSDVFPEEIPFLFPGDPLFIVGRYAGGGSARIKVSGYIGEDRWSERIRVALPFHEEENQVIASVWARQKIHQLQRYLLDAQDDETEQDLIGVITETALTYQLLSDYTSFVAVSKEVRTDDQGNSINVEIPVNMPEGMSYQGTFGSSSGGLAPEAVGATVITVAGQRGMILRDVTSSVSVVFRDEVRTMPVQSSAVSGSSTTQGGSRADTFISRERDFTTTLESGATVSVLSAALSTPVLNEEEYSELVSLVINCAADIYSRQEFLEDGMLILRLLFPGGEGEFEVVVVQNFTDSDQLAERVSEAIEMLSPDDVIYRGLVVEMAIEFAAP